MPLDASIITNMQQPDFSSAITEGLKAGAYMRNMADQHSLNAIKNQEARQQWNDQQIMREAKDAGTTVDEDGNISVDRPTVMSNLANSDSPHLAMQAQMDFLQQDSNARTMKLAAIHSKNEYSGQLAGAAISGGNQQALDKANADLQKNGPALGFTQDEIDQSPKVWNEATKQILTSHQAMSQTTNEQIEQNFKQSGQKIEQIKALTEAKKLGIDVDKIYGTPLSQKLPNGKSVSPGTNMQEVDPATLISHVPESMKQDVTKEIGRNSRIADALPKLIQNLKNAGDKIKKGIYTPEALNEDLENFHANLGPLVVEEQGAARQQAIDSLSADFSPTNLQKYRGNIDDIVNKKVKGLIQYGQNRMDSSASTSTPIGDLKNYKKTSLDPDALMKIQAEHPQDAVAIQFAKDHPNDPRSAIILQRNGISNTVTR